jgi:hypothetical protein
MGRQARCAAEEKFDMRHLARAYEELYAELVSTYPRAPVDVASG